MKLWFLQLQSIWIWPIYLRPYILTAYIGMAYIDVAYTMTYTVTAGKVTAYIRYGTIQVRPYIVVAYTVTV